MQFITGRHIPRRTFLQGVGATVALPFLDAMVPAGRAWSRAAQTADPTRLIAAEIVHGSAGANEWGATQNLWSPAAVGRDVRHDGVVVLVVPLLRHLDAVAVP